VSQPASQENPAGMTPPKGRPTPSRKEAQAAKARPLVANKLDKDAVRAQRLQQREARERARVGQMMGDERYLMERDRGPQRRWIRDYVDSRWSFGEFMVPLMVLILVLTFIPDPRIQFVVLAVIWTYVALSILGAVLLGRKVHRKLAEKFGADKVQSGSRMYAAMRSLQMRMLRVPKPQVKRGTKLQ